MSGVGLDGEWWEACRRSELVYRACPECGEVSSILRRFCVSCNSEMEWRKSAGLGEVFTYSVVNRGIGAGVTGDLPYVLAYVDLDEGPRFLTNLVMEDGRGPVIGDRVEVRFGTVEDHAVPYFVPVDSP
ncbi:MAG: OB-fold domain-containing protein [Acidimicrobiia bacterium]